MKFIRKIVAYIINKYNKIQFRNSTIIFIFDMRFICYDKKNNNFLGFCVNEIKEKKIFLLSV